VSAVTRLTPGITTMIRMDHTHVFALFHRYKADTPDGRKRALLANACLALEVHAQLEEEIFYPALRRVISDDDVLKRSAPEHDEMREFIAQLREFLKSTDRVSTTVDDTFLKLMRAVIHHVADEETHLLPLAERLLRDELGELGIRMTRRRFELVKAHVGEIAVSAARSFPAATAAGAVVLAVGAVAIGATLLSRRRPAAKRRTFLN
jgi:hemerythrin superfamily protein